MNGEAWETLSAAYESEAGAVGSTPVTNRNSIDPLINHHQLSRTPRPAKRVQSRVLKILLDRETAAFVCT
jgi:hypothetical protein